jgi:general secretion pathway protein K
MAAILKDNKGVALILTITLIGLMVVMILEFGKSIRTSLYETTNFSDGIRLEAIAKSGFNCALAVLYTDDTSMDTLQDDWATLGQYSSTSTSMFDNDGNFQTEIADLSGRIQINRLIITTGENKGDYDQKQKDMMNRLLSNPPFSMNQEKINEILDSIKDWLDEDSDQEINGAENSNYMSLDHPYSCRNGLLASIDELVLVKGITPELLYGTDETPGLANYLTAVPGDGRININTASREVLAALSEDLESGSEMVDEMIEYRNDEKNLDNLKKTDWYKTATTTTTGEDIIDKNLITIKSSYFEIRSRGMRDDRSKMVIGDIKREGKNLTMLWWNII